MNERIRELRRQATLVETYTSHDGSVHEGKSVDLEKFAELIVKEMVDECAKVCVQHAGWTPDMIANQVKQHFGVEE